MQYYNENAQKFIDNTLNVDMSEFYNKFLEFIPPNGRILDIGCGPGRDLHYFKKQGYTAIGIEPSNELCKFAKSYAKCEVKNISIQDIHPQEKFEGIWASASLLHLKPIELIESLAKIAQLMTEDSPFYCSFKKGDFEGNRPDGRFFLDLNLEKFTSIIKETNALSIRELWITNDKRPEKAKDQWINAILFLQESKSLG